MPATFDIAVISGAGLARSYPAVLSLFVNFKYFRHFKCFRHFSRTAILVSQ